MATKKTKLVRARKARKITSARLARERRKGDISIILKKAGRITIGDKFKVSTALPQYNIWNTLLNQYKDPILKNELKKGLKRLEKFNFKKASEEEIEKLKEDLLTQQLVINQLIYKLEDPMRAQKIKQAAATNKPYVKLENLDGSVTYEKVLTKKEQEREEKLKAGEDGENEEISFKTDLDYALKERGIFIDGISNVISKMTKAEKMEISHLKTEGRWNELEQFIEKIAERPAAWAKQLRKLEFEAAQVVKVKPIIKRYSELNKAKGVYRPIRGKK